MAKVDPIYKKDPPFFSRCILPDTYVQSMLLINKCMGEAVKESGAAFLEPRWRTQIATTWKLQESFDYEGLAAKEFTRIWAHMTVTLTSAMIWNHIFDSLGKTKKAYSLADKACQQFEKRLS